MNDKAREFLRQAATHAGFPPSEADRFCAQVEKRLDKGAKEYGELRYLERTFPECEGEAIEEQADAGGWSSLGLRLLARDVEQGFPPDVADLVRLHIYEGVSLAQRSARAFEDGVGLYMEHSHLIRPPSP